MGTRDNRLASGKPFGWSRLIERGRLGVKFHIARVDTRAEDPWVVEIALAGLNKEHLEVVIKIGESKVLAWISNPPHCSWASGLPSSHDTTATPTTTDDNVKFLRETHIGY